MNIIFEFLIVSLSFWLVSNRMEGIEMKESSTVFKAAAVYMISYFFLKNLLMFSFAILTLGFMFGLGFIAIVVAALGSMYVTTKLVKDYNIDSFAVIAAATLVISVLSSILRIVFFFNWRCSVLYSNIVI